jgi:hypothetical protein
MNVEGDLEDIGPVQTEFPLNLLATVLSARHCGLAPEDIARVIESDRSSGALR